MEELVKQERCRHNYQVLPNDVKETFPLISKETYNSSAMYVQCTNTRDQGLGTFYLLYCTYCINHFLLTVLKTYKSYLPESAEVEDLMSHWDEIEVNDKKIIDWKKICGIVFPSEPDIIAVPNNHKFILRPVDHSKMKHYQMLAQGSSSSPSLTTFSLLTSTSRKRPATTDTSVEPLQSAFLKKSTNVLTSFKGMLSTSAENTKKQSILKRTSLCISFLKEKRSSTNDEC